MEIGPVNRTTMNAPVNAQLPSQGAQSFVRQIVTAVRGVNQSELLGEGRELAFTRDPDTHMPVIQIVERATGDVIDQIPPEVLLRMKAQLDKKQR